MIVLQMHRVKQSQLKLMCLSTNKQVGSHNNTKLGVSTDQLDQQLARHPLSYHVVYG